MKRTYALRFTFENGEQVEIGGLVVLVIGMVCGWLAALGLIGLVEQAAEDD